MSTLPRPLREASAVKTLKDRFYRLLLTKRSMRFPSFDEDLHHRLTKKQDYFRYATLVLALQRLQEEHLAGAMAEVGVFRGETSQVLHTAAPNRTLYLFDTFAGFPTHQLESWQKDDTRFRDTSLAQVRSQFKHADRVVVRAGYVPDTLAGLEDERFAFVLLDLDIYEPTVASLEFFYPRLVAGGYLVIHDYNNPESDWACKRAFDDFLADKPEHLIEIADRWGSAFIRKSAC